MKVLAVEELPKEIEQHFLELTLEKVSFNRALFCKRDQHSISKNGAIRLWRLVIGTCIAHR